jgi:DNA replication protein DnaC
LNAQQMPAQLAVYLSLSMPLYHASRSFQFINTSEEESKAKILLPSSMLNKLEGESTEIFCKSSIDKYRNRPQHLSDICLAHFVAKFNVNNFKEFSVPQIIQWVNFNLYRDPENHYREQLLLFCPFHGFEESLKNGHDTWHDAFNEQQEYMTPICNQYVHKFKTGSQYKDEWSTLQCHVDEFSKMHMNDASIDIPLPVAMNDLNNRPQCFISTNTEGIEPYDLSIEKKEQRYRKKYGNKTAHNCPDEIVSNNEFASLVQQLNSEQRIILDDILYKKRRNPRISLFIFITGGAGTGKTFTLLCIIQYLLRYYNKINLEADPLKQKVMKLGYTGKAAFNIGGSTIHSALGIPLNKSLLELGGLSDERRDSFAKTYDQLRLLVIDEISLVGSRMFAMIDRRLRTIMRAHNNFMGGLDVIVTGDLYQTPPVRDAWIFKSQSGGLNELAPNFWKERANCYELVQVMRQKDLQFIGILTRCQTTTQTEHDISYINKLCFRLPPTDITFPHLFYTNVKTNEHKKYVFDNTLGETYKFVARDIPS